MIYLDNAATTLRKPQQVIDAVAEAMGALGNSARGTHGGSLAASRVVYGAREKAAALFGCPRADHVVFTCNSTEALNIAIHGGIPAGSHVISTDLEHNSVLRPLYRLEREGRASLSFVPADRRGRIDYADFERLLRPETRAVVCTHASNLTGNLVDIARVGAFARAHGLLFIVDASQTAGVFPIAMEEMGIDVLCLPGHKGLLGPQGIGLLCLRPGVELRPLLVGGSGILSFSHTHPSALPDGLEAGTRNNPGIAGLGAGLEWLQTQGVERLWAQTEQRLRQLYEGLHAIPGVTIYGDWSTFHRAPVLAMNLDGWEAAQLSDVLYEEFDIATRPGAHCAPLMHLALGTGEAGAVRISAGCSTTSEDVDAAIAAVAQLAKEE